MEQLQYPIGRFEKPQNFDHELINLSIVSIKHLPDVIEKTIENMDEFQLQTPYREGGWTVHQLVHHLADSHMNAYLRLKMALTEDQPIVKPYNEKLWANLADTAFVPVNVSITLLHAMHRRLVVLLEHMQPADWERSYYHPEQKKIVKLWEMVSMYAWHGRHHAEHIIQLKLRNNW